jgi:glycerol-3-phosphate acyltransferase PlsY
LFEAIYPFLFCALMGYLLGAFPTGYFVGRLWNVDVRKHGSGRTGGTNVLRTVGWGGFLLTAFGDLGKGILATILAQNFFPKAPDAHALTVLAVLVGHNWSVWIALLAKPDPRITYARPPLGWIQRIAQQGRGGAGVAAASGAGVVLLPQALILISFFVVVLFVARYASVASLTLACTIPVFTLYFVLNGSAPWSYFIVALIVCIIIVIVHIPNIQRLRAGTEKRFGERLGQRQPRKPQEPGK